MSTEGGIPCSMLVSIGQTRNMMGWSLTKQGESSVRSAWLIPAARLDKLDAWLSSTLGDQGKEQMACIIETTHGLLIAFLLEHGWPVYPVNPRSVDRKRSASGAKTDAIDAYLLAKTGRADFVDLHQLTPIARKWPNSKP